MKIRFFSAILLFFLLLPGYSATVGATVVTLTDEERDWIAKHPVLQVGNELDWPPFDFAENGEPKGYSIDLINLIGEKTGLEFEFVNGYTWPELLEKFKAGEIDIMPAIYMDEQRKSYIAFTDSYFSQPSVIVVREDRADIEKLADLAGKKLAVIAGYSITQALAKSHPEIKRIPFKGVVDAIKAVSLGEVDAFIEILLDCKGNNTNTVNEGVYLAQGYGFNCFDNTFDGNPFDFGVAFRQGFSYGMTLYDGQLLAR